MGQDKWRDTASFHLPAWKRGFDILFATLALLALSPLLLLVALLIRLESKGPVIYASKRVGMNYQIFNFLKFRSMYVDADKRLKEFNQLNQYLKEETVEGGDGQAPAQDSLPKNQTMLVSDEDFIPEHIYIRQRTKEKRNSFVKLENDPRITRTGRFIRKYSIDELPQLINVLRGEMSVIGNRPLPLYEAELLTNDENIDRFMAPAGLTGLWQVEKQRNTGSPSAEERKQLDCQYAQEFGFCMDMKILARTFTAFIQKENS
jgi:lipopolysaccharide/colanic/teichoic acid biosynthesis glycosyltransferase